MKRTSTSSVIKLVDYFLIVLCSSACTKQVHCYTNSDNISLCAFIISDNDLDDHTDYIENDFVRGLKDCPVGTEMFLYIDRQTETPSLRPFLLHISCQICFSFQQAYVLPLARCNAFATPDYPFYPIGIVPLS